MNKTLLIWSFLFCFGTIIVIIFMYQNTMQNTNVQSNANVETLTETIRAGNARMYANETSDFTYVNQDELVENLLGKIALHQSNHKQSLRIQYVFIDELGNETNDDAHIRGIHYAIHYLNVEGDTTATTEKRLMFHTLQTE